FITNNYSEFYHHPKTYEQFEEYKEIAAMSRQGRNATVLASGNSAAFGDNSYDDGEDDMDEGVHNTSSLYLRPEVTERVKGFCICWSSASLIHSIRTWKWEVL